MSAIGVDAFPTGHQQRSYMDYSSLLLSGHVLLAESHTCIVTAHEYIVDKKRDTLVD